MTGVAILINERNDITICNSFSDTHGHAIGLVYEEANEKFILLNIYAPNEDDPQFFVEALQLMNEYEGKRIVVGDFNLALDVKLDRTEGSSKNSPIKG